MDSAHVTVSSRETVAGPVAYLRPPGGASPFIGLANRFVLAPGVWCILDKSEYFLVASRWN